MYYFHFIIPKKSRKTYSAYPNYVLNRRFSLLHVATTLKEKLIQDRAELLVPDFKPHLLDSDVPFNFITIFQPHSV